MPFGWVRGYTVPVLFVDVPFRRITHTCGSRPTVGRLPSKQFMSVQIWRSAQTLFEIVGMSRLGSGPESMRPACHWVGRRSKAMKVPKSYVLSQCCKAYSNPKGKVCSRCGQKLRPAFIMPTCPESGKPVNQCRCDKCPIPF